MARKVKPRKLYCIKGGATFVQWFDAKKCPCCKESVGIVFSKGANV